jgi:SMODS and SLOG-associating 2TM effector domain 1/Protein of unknown function (DUF4231)/SLOG in TRPM, prokaryote
VSEASGAVGARRSTGVVRASVDADVNAVVSSLQIDVPCPVLVLAGDLEAAEGGPGSLTEEIQAAVRVAASRTEAVVLDGTSWGGSNPDIAESNGQASVPPDGSYSHVVMAETVAGQEDPHLLAALGQAVARGMPTALLLAGGDDAALAEAALALERGFGIFVAAGSGGAADRIATAMHAHRSTDPAAAAIVARARATGTQHVHVVPVAPDRELALTRALIWALHRDRVLKDAWRLFTTFDNAAVRLRASFERFQATILLVGLLATLLALLTKQLGSGGLRWAVVAASVALAGLTALSGRRAAGKRWIVTRAAAESVKSEIFRYRTRTGRYADSRLPGRDKSRRPEVLAVRLGAIETRLMHTEVGNSALPDDGWFDPPGADHSGDDGLSPLTAEDYVAMRIDDQLRYYHARLHTYDRRRQALQGIALLASSAGALVAALGGQIWVAMTSVLAAAPLSYLAHLQVEKTIVTYNQSVAQLDDVLRRWHGRSSHLPTPQAFARLVDATEGILTAEHGAWVQEMTEAMHDLDNEQHATGPDDAGKQ